MDYSIHEHKHRFAAWAASRSASVIGCRFSVEEGKVILEDAGFNQLLISADTLPQPSRIDAAHRGWRIDVIAAANHQRPENPTLVSPRVGHDLTKKTDRRSHQVRFGSDSIIVTASIAAGFFAAFFSARSVNAPTGSASNFV